MKISVEDREFNISTKVIYMIVGSIVSIIVGTITFIDYMDERHATQVKMMQEDAKLQRRILMSESTRYAEVAKYYYDEQKKRPLSEAEEKRLQLVEKQQERITDTLLEEE